MIIKKVRRTTKILGDLDQALLQLIAASHKPVGQGVLSLQLRRRGFSLSTPTVGRRLQELEFEGLLQKVGVDGRVITKPGRRVLDQVESETRLRRSGEFVLDILQRGDKRHILDLLAARRVIEEETVALAAQHATARDLREMEELLRKQANMVGRGGLGIEEDVQFHHVIARASQNAVLSSLVSLLRNHQRFNFLVASMRAVVGSNLVVDHTAILQAIKRHDPEAARQAMDDHLRKLSDDLNRYWRQWVRNNSTGAR